MSCATVETQAVIKNISMPDKAIETKQIDTQAHYGLDVLLDRIHHQ
jgi:hypothetical protein